MKKAPHAYSVHFFLTCLFFLLCSTAADAQVVADLGQMVENFSKTVPELMRLVTAFSYVMGFFLVIRGIIEFKHFGQSRTQMSYEHHISTPIILTLTGTALIYLPSAIHVGTSTFWGSTTPYAYSTEESDQWNEFFKAFFLLIQFIGVIAFIRGIIILSHIGSRGHQQEFGKAMAYIIAGILCINMYAFLVVVGNTLGIPVLTDIVS